MLARDTVVVTISGNRYEVGPDSELATDVQHAQVTDDAYVTRPEYQALSLGALAYMRARKIDLLVAGLPVSRVESQAERVKALLEGRHTINGRCVEVVRVVVLAQPVGGALHSAMENCRLAQFRDETTLTIDIGAGTNDALVSRGLQILPKRCASHAGGTSALLRQLADTLSARHGVECSMVLLDKALRSGTLKIAGRTYPLLSLLPATRPVVDQAINALMSRIGTVSDIDRIILVGGGARFFKPGIRARFPDHPIEVSEAGIFANVCGFQIAGERVAGAGDGP